MENLCLIMIHSEVNPKRFDAEIRELYAQEQDTCYVRISDRLNLFQRAVLLRKVRKVYSEASVHVKAVSDRSILLLNEFILWHQNLADEIARRLNVFGIVLYRLWQRWKVRCEKV